MSDRADEERRIDALYRAIINAITYTALEWHVTQREVFTALQDAKDHVAEIFIRGSNRKQPPKKDDEEKDE